MQRIKKSATTRKRRCKIRMKPLFRIIIIIAIIAFVIVFREKLLKLSYPVFTAIFIIYLIRPLVRILMRKGIKTGLSILLIYAFIILSLVSFLIFAMPQIVSSLKELSALLPNLTDEYREIIDNIFNFVRLSAWPDEAKEAILGEIDKLSTAVSSLILTTISKSFITIMEACSLIVSFTLGMVIAFYILKDNDRIKKAAVKLLPSKHRDSICATGRDIDSVLSSFISGQLTVALIISLLEIFGLWVVGIKFPVLMGIFGGISNIIPYFGPFVGAIPAVALSLVYSPGMALKAALVFIIVQQIDNAFISPRIMEQKLGLHPLATIFAILTGAAFLGLAGMIVAVPVTAITKIIIKRFINLS